MVDRQLTRIAAHGVCVADGCLLLVRLAPPAHELGAWSLPGGGIEWGETPAEALVREVYEETGLQATPGSVLGVYSTVFERTVERPLDPLHFMSVVHEMTVAGGEVIHEVEGSTDLAAWVPLSDVDDEPLVGLARFGLDLLATIDRPARPATPTHPVIPAASDAYIG